MKSKVNTSDWRCLFGGLDAVSSEEPSRFLCGLKRSDVVYVDKQPLWYFRANSGLFIAFLLVQYKYHPYIL